METKNEIWKPVKDYEGLYEVSNFGRVRSVDHYVKQPNPHDGKLQQVLRRGCVMKPSFTGSGYLHLSLSSGLRKYKTFQIHRLVAIHFIENPENLAEVNHKNEDKTDNRVENLEWCSRQYNVYYGNNTKTKPVLQMDDNGNVIKKFRSAREAAMILGLNHSSISGVCKGRFYKTGGYRWRYADD